MLLAQPEAYNHPELNWRTIETKHFYVHYHQGTERTANLTAKIAEEVYGSITSLYQYEPDTKVHFIIKDTDDYSNAAAYYYDNKILLWATAMDFDLRGTHNWLRNVITHEYTHIISLGAARKGPRRIPNLYLQYIDYEKEKRPDVLYGYPNTLISYPLPGTIIPPWFAEGMAQYQRAGLPYEHWDSHRDMILRMMTLSHTLLSYDEMGSFGKNSLGNESVYNQGFSLVTYIVQNYGEENLRRICHQMTNPFQFSFDGALKKIIGLDGEVLYHQWKTHLEGIYANRTEAIRAYPRAGHPIEEGGYANLYPRFSPEGKKLAYLSNKNNDYLSQTTLYIYDVETGKRVKTGIGARSSLSWTSDGKRILYSRQKGVNRTGSHFDDIFVYDLETQKEERITHFLRASSPDVSPDGRRVVFVINKDGCHNLGVVDLNGDNLVVLTNFSDGRQVYHPRWSPDGKKIIFATATDAGRDIAEINADGSGFHFILRGKEDERDPVYSPDGEGIFYSSDVTGIYNIYHLSLQDSSIMLVTNVLGGAFMPSINPTGQLVYSEYGDGGYKISFLEEVAKVAEESAKYIQDYPTLIPDNDYDDSQFDPRPSVSYKPLFGTMFLAPRIAFDYRTFKPGLYFYSSDFLEQLSLLGGFAINARQDYDLFGIVEFRRFHPTFFFEAYNLVRHQSDSFQDPYRIVGETEDGIPVYDRYSVDYRFDLMEFDLGGRLKITDTQEAQAALIMNRYQGSMALSPGVKFSYTYFKGITVSLKWEYKKFRRAVDSWINPRGGRHLTLEYARENNRFIEGFEINAKWGTLQEVYNKYNYNRWYLHYREHLALPLGRHALTLGFQGGVIDRDVDEFFHYYAGGLPGMRGYTYFSLGGQRMVVGSLTYRFPILSQLGWNILSMRLDRLYGAFFFDYGNAWNHTQGGLMDFIKGDFKRDWGWELRLGAFSFYNFPTAIFWASAYGLDRFESDIRQIRRQYGGEWRNYFGVLFGFDI